MKTLGRYILVEYLKALAVSAAVFTGFAAAASLYQISEHAGKSGVGAGVMLPLAGYLIPYVLLYAMPLSLFTACIIAFGRLSADNEFVAIKAAGINPATAIAPVLGLGLAASLVCVVLADVGLAFGFSAIRTRLLAAAPEVVAGSLVPGRSVTFTPRDASRYTINVLPGEDDSPRISVAIFEGGKLERLILARAFDIDVRSRKRGSGESAHVLRFRLADGEILTSLSLPDAEEGAAPPKGPPAGLYRPITFEKYRLDVPLSSVLSNRLNIGRRAQTMGLSQNLSVVRYCDDNRDRCLIRRATLEARIKSMSPEDAGGKAGKVAEGELDRIQQDIKWNARKRRRVLTEFHRKLSISFSCLAFVLLGVPLGLAARQKSRAMGFALGTGLAFCGYYPMLVLGKTMSESGTVAPWIGMWVPAAIVTFIGACWSLRVVRR